MNCSIMGNKKASEKLKIEPKNDLLEISNPILDSLKERGGNTKSIVDQINIEDVCDRIAIEKDIEVIAKFLRYISIGSINTSCEILSRMNIDNVIEKISKERDINKIATFFINTSRIEFEFCESLFDLFLQKACNIKDVKLMNGFLRRISQGNKIIEYELITKISIPQYISLINNKKSSIGDIIKLLFHIYGSSWSGKKIVIEILDNINPLIFHKKLLNYPIEETEKIHSQISKISISFVDKLRSTSFMCELKQIDMR